MCSKKIVKILCAAVILLPILLSAQNLPCRTYGGTMNERAHALVQSADDFSYVMAGFTTMAMDTNLLIVKIDSFGDTLKAKISYGLNTEIATSMIKTTLEPGYALTGWTRSYKPLGALGSKANIFVIKLAANLAVQWGFVYSTYGDYEEQAYSIIEVTTHPLSGPGYAVVGWTEYSGSNPSPAMFIMRLNPAGIQQWVKIYNRRTFGEMGWVNTPAQGYDIVAIPVVMPYFPNGGFAVTGRGFNPMMANWDAIVMCVDNNGLIVMPLCKVLPGMYEDEGYSIILDGMDLVVAGWTNSYGPGAGTIGAPANIFVWKMDLLGTDLWNKIYGWAAGDEKVMDEQSLIKTSDGMYALSGWTKSVGPGAPPNPNFLIMKIFSQDGSILWSRVHPSIPGANSEEAYPIIETYGPTGAPKGYAIAGWTNSFGVGPQGTEDFHFLTLDQNGDRPVCVLPIRPDTCSFWTYMDSAVLMTEGFDTTRIPLKDTSVLFVDVCEIVEEGDATPTDIDVPDTVEVCHPLWIPVTVTNVGTGTLQAGWYVHMQIQRGTEVPWYDESVYVAVPILPQATHTVNFYVHFLIYCNHQITVTTAYPGDPYPNNDVLTKLVVARYTDPFEITELSINPSQMLYHVGDYIMIDVKVHNNNKHVIDSMLTAYVYLDIQRPDMSVTRDSQQVVNIPPCSTVTLWFPTTGELELDTTGQWYFDAFPEDIPGDSHPENNYADSTITVNPPLPSADAGIDDLDVPDTVEVCHPADIWVTVKNFGTVTLPAGWFFYLEIERNDTIWERDSFYVADSLTIGQMLSHNFNICFIPCNHLVRVFTAYPNDNYPNNDTATKSVVARLTDPFEITELSINPSQSTYHVGDYVMIDVKVHNNNKHVIDSMLTAWVYLDIQDPNYSVTRDSQKVENIPPCSTVTLWFPTTGELELDATGQWYFDVFPEAIPADSHPENNYADSTILVSPAAVPGWAQLESIVTPHVDKTIKDGGALVGVPGTDKDAAKLYAFLGTKTNRFKKYTVGSGWSDAESLLFGHKYKAATYTVDTVKFAKKFPGKGAALCFDNDHTIYATKGNGTNEFFAYDILTGIWTAKAFVPSLKGLKGGTSIRWYNGKVYLLAGSQKKDITVDNFFEYNPTGDSDLGTPWTALGKLPLGPDTKNWKDGSSIIELDDTIYAIHGGAKTNLFYAYDWGTNTWLSKEVMPIDDSSYHKYKKKLLVKDGAATASGDGVIYATKGGGTEPFWKYTPGTPGVWERLGRIPIEKIDKKHAPKTGAAMAFVDGKIYLLVGNKQVDFWCYTSDVKLNVKAQKSKVTEGVITSQGEAISNLSFTFDVNPNPITKLTTIRYTVPISGKVAIKLYNASGRLIETLVNDNLSAGTHSFNLSANKLAKGVYFVKYESDTNKSELKLVIQ